VPPKGRKKRRSGTTARTHCPRRDTFSATNATECTCTGGGGVTATAAAITAIVAIAAVAAVAAVAAGAKTRSRRPLLTSFPIVTVSARRVESARLKCGDVGCNGKERRRRQQQNNNNRLLRKHRDDYV